MLTGDKPVAEIESELVLPIPVQREYKWVKFVLKGTQIDVLALLRDSLDRISDFTTKIYLRKH